MDMTVSQETLDQINDLVYGTLFDNHGNRDDDGLVFVKTDNEKRARDLLIKVLEESS